VALNDSNFIKALFVDYSKAFDNVDHSTGLSKMTALHIHPYPLKWVHSFLLDSQQRVKIGNHHSDWIPLTGGVSQGTWFGPYLFLILIDDLSIIMATFKFVDDVTLTELIDQSNISRRQLAADQVADWSHRNFMKTNTKNTKGMLFGRNTKDLPFQITFNAGAIDQTARFNNQGQLELGEPRER
jgi:Reverse transcriptase (RNA-dependent DNA polymerase)